MAFFYDEYLRREVPRLSNVLNLEQEKISEMAMVDLAYHLLAQSKKPVHYRDLFNEVAELKHITEEGAMDLIAQLYTEINLDGRFICLGDNLWGLKRWYLVETQEESAEGSLRGKFVLDDDDFDDDEDLEEEYGLDDDEPVNNLDDDDDNDADDDDEEEIDGFDDEAEEELEDEDLDDESESENDEDLDRK
jgi:DNA-directed RNA polymerase subunit delta